MIGTPYCGLRAQCLFSNARLLIAAQLVFATASAEAVEAEPPYVPPAARSEEAPLEVVVQGDRLEPKLGSRDRSVASSVVDRERLVGPGLQAQDVLRGEPGVVITESGGFGSPAGASIRGAGAASTPVYLGGVRLNDDVGGIADLSLVPLWLVHHVEVYRGNAPIEADRLTPGGAIFFEPRRPTHRSSGVGFYGGSWGTIKGWSFAGARDRSVSTLIGVSVDRSGNRYPYENDQGMVLAPVQKTTEVRENGDLRTVDGWGITRVDVGDGITIDVMVNSIGREQGVPRLALLPSRAARHRANRTLGAVTTTVPLNRARTGVLELKTVAVFARTAYDDPLLELALRSPRLDIVGRRVEQTVAARVDLSEAARLHSRLTLAQEHLEREPDNGAPSRAQREFARAAVGARHTLSEHFALQGLVGTECHHTGNAVGTFCNFSNPAGRIGVEWRSQRVQVLASGGHYLRVPTLGELYGISGTIHGNAALSPESGYTTDWGVRARSGPGSLLRGAYLDAFVFARWARELVAYARAGQGFVSPFNVGRARVIGVEMLAGVALTSIFRSELSVTLVDPRDTSPQRGIANDTLPYRSRLIAAPRVVLHWQAERRRWLSGVAGRLGCIYQSSRYADPAGLGVIGAQTSVDFDAMIALFQEKLTTRLRVADLFDSKRTDMVGYPLPGRSVYFGMEATWQ